MPSVLPQREVDAANAAADFAASVRKVHRRNTDKSDPQRQRDIDVALTRIRTAMRPLKSEIGRFPYGPQTTVAEANRETIRAASKRLQDERRKLWKMAQPTPEETW